MVVSGLKAMTSIGMPSKIISLPLLVKTRLLNKSWSILESKGMRAIFQKRGKNVRAVVCVRLLSAINC